MKILLTEIADEDRTYFSVGLNGNDLTFQTGHLQSITPKELVDVEAISVFLGSRLDAETMDLMPKLKRIATRSTGFDHIDLQEASRRGVSVFNVPEYGSATVAEHTFALILSLTRKVHKAYVRTLLGEFQLGGLLGTDLSGKKLGVIGLGKIGRHVARIGFGFDMRVEAYDPVAEDWPNYVSSVELSELFSSSDVIAVCCPLNASTHHLVSEKYLKRLKPGAILVNTARGPIVDTKALLAALIDGKLAGAALDVLEGEEMLSEDAILSRLAAPWSDDMENIARNLALMRHPNLIVTPHMAFYSHEALERIRETTVQNLLVDLNHDSPNRVSAVVPVGG